MGAVDGRLCLKRREARGRIRVAADNPLSGELKRMAYSRETAVERAREDLASRLGKTEGDVEEESVEEADFPNTALGAPADGEMSGMMISSGWRIKLRADGDSYEYRADRNQLRLYNFNGSNHKILEARVWGLGASWWRSRLRLLDPEC